MKHCTTLLETRPLYRGKIRQLQRLVGQRAARLG
jgi:hypothetical protein